MIETNPSLQVIDLLRAAAQSPQLPQRARQAGERLVERLTSPIRVAILGHPKSGKSQILNLFAGDVIVPDEKRLPTLEVAWGEETATVFHYADGTTDRVAGCDLSTVTRTDIELVQIEAPLPILKKITLIEVVTRGTAEDEREGVVWASERADIVLWCSQEFSLAEQWLWSAMPDRLKDHGFLLLTKADALIRKGVLADRIAALEEIVAEEFHSLVPVAALQGLKAREADGGMDEAMFTSSGARALIAAILRHVEQGRRADLDSALLFLARFGHAIPAAAQAEVEMPTLQQPKSTSNPIRGALSYLTDRAANLNAAIAEIEPQDVLEHCVETANQIVELFGDDLYEDGPLAVAQDDVMEVSEMLLLMQLERGDGPAADAVTLLLQLRRNLAQSLAA